MTKYYVTVEAETTVTLEELYLVYANDPVDAEAIVQGGGGEYIDETIKDYGKTLNERVVSVTTKGA
jgi:hypothetical protein